MFTQTLIPALGFFALGVLIAYMFFSNSTDNS